MRKIWLATTEHMETGLWFRDDEDFKVAMNYVAILAFRRKVVVLAFILMSNHVHFVFLAPQKEDAEGFVNALKHRYSLYLSKKYGIRELLRRNKVRVDLIPFGDEAPERVFAYVVMNCVEANICSHPSQYPWGTGNLYFSLSKPVGKPLSSMSKRARGRLLHTNSDELPKHWLISDDGYVLPQNYVDINAVESLYRTPKRMNFFLANSSKARKQVGASEDHLPAFRDQTILAALPDLYRTLFGKDRFEELSKDEQKEFVRQIRFRFSADVNQIARVCGLTYKAAADLIDSA